MKIAIVGYGEMFKALVLGVLKSEHELCAVFRHDNVLLNPCEKLFFDILKPSNDYNFIKTHNLKEIKAISVNSKKFIKEIKKLEIDVILVGSWSERFSKNVINSPKIACINTHPSLLPKYRGPNPYLQVILNDEKSTGVTFHLMDKSFDTGEIIHQTEVPIISTDTGATLKTRCCDTARNEVSLLLDNLQEKLQNKKAQNEKEAFYKHHISLKETILDFTNETSIQIDRRIRALTPWVDCHICHKQDYFSFKTYKIKDKTTALPATIINKTENSISIVCKDGIVIEFFTLKIKQPFSNFYTKFYLKNFLKINEKAE